jgi:hypothetical protein
MSPAKAGSGIEDGPTAGSRQRLRSGARHPQTHLMVLARETGPCASVESMGGDIFVPWLSFSIGFIRLQSKGRYSDALLNKASLALAAQ